MAASICLTEVSFLILDSYNFLIHYQILSGLRQSVWLNNLGLHSDSLAYNVAVHFKDKSCARML